MPITLKQFENIFRNIAPPECAYPWDNSGTTLAVHDVISRVLIALDLTENVINEAKEKGCDTILLHHPPIFSPIKKLSVADPATGLVILAAQNKINLYAAHTSSDCAPRGVNFAFSNALGLKNTELFIKEEQESAFGLGYLGDLDKPMHPDELAKFVKTALHSERVRYNKCEKKVTRVALVGGSGGEFFLEAKLKGAEALITGEAKYNQFLDSAYADVLLIEAGHYETEQIFVDAIYQELTHELEAQRYGVALFKSDTALVPYYTI